MDEWGVVMEFLFFFRLLLEFIRDGWNCHVNRVEMIYTKGLKVSKFKDSKMDEPSVWIEVAVGDWLFRINLYSTSWWKMLLYILEIWVILKNYKSC